MAVDYALHYHNRMPQPVPGMMSPLNLLLKCNHLNPTSKICMFGDVHVTFWSHKFKMVQTSKMETTVTSGIFVGFLPHHSSLIPLVLNTRTGKISPQFHVVFNDWFASVTSVGGDEAFDPSQWQELFTTSRYQYMFNLTDPNVLSEEWIDN